MTAYPNSATNHYDLLHDLTPKQLRAIDALDSGATHLEAAEAAGVHRVTVTDWLKKHPAFIAELNRRQQERIGKTAHRIEAVTAEAVEVIAKAIAVGNLDASFKWMKQVGALELERSTSLTDSTDVLEAHASKWSDAQLLKGMGAFDTRPYTELLEAEFSDQAEALD